MELSIDPDVVCFIVIKAREYDAMVQMEELDDGDNPADDDERSALLETDNATREEIVGALESLTLDQRAELVALLRIGRGDYEADDWDDAVATARDRPEMRRADSLLSVPMLADYLEEGLSRFGHTCAETERDHL